VLLDDLFANPETDPGSGLSFAREKLLEHSGPYFLADSRARVAYQQSNPATAVHLRREMDRQCTAIGHRVDCISDNIDQHLPDLTWQYDHVWYLTVVPYHAL
jgi:hypothetical protein